MFIKDLGKFSENVQEEDEDYRFVLSERFGNQRFEKYLVGVGGLDTNIIFSRIVLHPPQEKMMKTITEKEALAAPDGKFVLFGYKDYMDNDKKDSETYDNNNQNPIYINCLKKQTEISQFNFCKNNFRVEVLRERCEVINIFDLTILT